MKKIPEPSAEMAKGSPDMPPPSMYMPVHKDHLKHAVVGKHVTAAIKGKVKGVRQKGDGTHEVEIEPSHSMLAPGGKGPNPYSDLVEDNDEDDMPQPKKGQES